MEYKERALSLWQAIHRQDWDALADFFAPDAQIFWHNTRERFTPGEFVRANSEYPGDWTVTVERAEEWGDLVVTAIQTRAGEASFHAVSFFQMGEDGRIVRLDEYWGGDGPPPRWRIDKQIGTPME